MMMKENRTKFRTLVMASISIYRRRGPREEITRQVEGKLGRAVLEKPKKDRGWSHHHRMP